ncbi:hypothetical protein GH714_015734 [Hevea brasiliensis]|uniref:PI31 proteasome regulator N-terminal domain-containing protein n=1 Tax=Hevea brasiliensis TaxID=3981 RepID=A0A6A6M118_HEVBR|nr:hypothetical protein GH714_015734 [Hevea brasiliensis]
MKCLVMNDKLLIDALADGASEPVHLEIDVVDFVGENGGANYSAQFKNMDKLVKNIDAEILSKLDGSSSKASSSSNRPNDGSRRDIKEPGIRITEPTGPQIHQIQPSGIIYPPVNPVGGSDLFPGPGGGMYPMRGGFGTGGSMLLGPNDPHWFSGESNFPGGQPGVPPGARFDPYGPPGVPGFEPNRFVRNPRRPGRDTHPDLEHFRSDSDFI